MKIVPFHPSHVSILKMQPDQARIATSLSPAFLQALSQNGPALTAMHGDHVLGCAGIAFGGFGIGTLWGMVSGDAGRHFVAIHRSVERFLDANPLRRIEASAEAQFGPACRWLEMLGFEQEGLMRKFGPDGSDYYRYARTL